MKKRFGFVMIMAAMVVAAYDDVQVVYRGQLKANGQAPAAQTMPMTFRLYAKKNSGTASWTTNGVVAIDDKGLFQVALRGEGLAEAIDSGKANWIGISIAGGKEHYPRQALLASPAAEKAVSAGSLADSPSVGTASVERVEADSLAVTGSLSVGGNVKMATPATSSSAVGMDARLTAGWHTLQMKGKVRFFNGGAPIRPWHEDGQRRRMLFRHGGLQLRRAVHVREFRHHAGHVAFREEGGICYDPVGNKYSRRNGRKVSALSDRRGVRKESLT